MGAMVKDGVTQSSGMICFTCLCEPDVSPRRSPQPYRHSLRRLKSTCGSSNGPQRVALHGGGDGRLVGHERQKSSDPGGWAEDGGDASALVTERQGLVHVRSLEMMPRAALRGLSTAACAGGLAARSGSCCRSSIEVLGSLLDRTGLAWLVARRP